MMRSKPKGSLRKHSHVRPHKISTAAGSSGRSFNRDRRSTSTGHHQSPTPLPRFSHPKANRSRPSSLARTKWPARASFESERHLFKSLYPIPYPGTKNADASQAERKRSSRTVPNSKTSSPPKTPPPHKQTSFRPGNKPFSILKRLSKTGEKEKSDKAGEKVKMTNKVSKGAPPPEIQITGPDGLKLENPPAYRKMKKQPLKQNEEGRLSVDHARRKKRTKKSSKKTKKDKGKSEASIKSKTFTKTKTVPKRNSQIRHNTFNTNPRANRTPANLKTEQEPKKRKLTKKPEFKNEKVDVGESRRKSSVATENPSTFSSLISLVLKSEHYRRNVVILVIILAEIAGITALALEVHIFVLDRNWNQVLWEEAALSDQRERGVFEGKTYRLDRHEYLRKARDYATRDIFPEVVFLFLISACMVSSLVHLIVWYLKPSLTESENPVYLVELVTVYVCCGVTCILSSLVLESAIVKIENNYEYAADMLFNFQHMFDHNSPNNESVTVETVTVICTDDEYKVGCAGYEFARVQAGHLEQIFRLCGQGSRYAKYYKYNDTKLSKTVEVHGEFYTRNDLEQLGFCSKDEYKYLAAIFVIIAGILFAIVPVVYCCEWRADEVDNYEVMYFAKPLPLPDEASVVLKQEVATPPEEKVESPEPKKAKECRLSLLDKVGIIRNFRLFIEGETENEEDPWKTLQVSHVPKCVPASTQAGLTYTVYKEKETETVMVATREIGVICPPGDFPGPPAAPDPCLCLPATTTTTPPSPPDIQSSCSFCQCEYCTCECDCD